MEPLMITNMSPAAPRLMYDVEHHHYYVDGVRIPSVTQLLAPVSFDYSTIPADTLNHAARRGTAVHIATEFVDAGELDEESLDPEVVPYVDAWRLFRRESGFETLQSEVRVYSPMHQFAGTFDCIGMMGGKLAIVEKKTTVSLHPSTAIQVSAYLRAYNEGRPREEHARWCYSVLLRPDGTYRLDEHEPGTHWGAFLALRYPDNPQSAATIAAWKRAYL